MQLADGFGIELNTSLRISDLAHAMRDDEHAEGQKLYDWLVLAADELLLRR